MTNLKPTFQHILENNTFFTYKEAREVIYMSEQTYGTFTNSRNGSKHCYYDIPVAFDIETSSFYDNGEKVSIMYAWTLNFYGYVIIGRTWEQLELCLSDMSDILGVNTNNRLLIYVHNLSFEFQYIRSHFEWDNVFCMEERKPLYALTKSGLEFRCSYLLSGFSLEKMGENLKTYETKKLSGYLDYDKIRHAKTILTGKELQYLANDGKVVVAWVMECIEEEGVIAKIPYTKTGYVRRYCRECCFGTGDKKEKQKQRRKYKEKIAGLTLTPELYDLCKQAFAGGFTHANPLNAFQVYENVASHDFNSAYPAVLITEKYPMGTPEYIPHITKQMFEESIQCFCCIFQIELNGLKAKMKAPDHYISESKCFYTDKKSLILDNGRIEQCECVRLTICNVDLEIIDLVYDYDSIRISNFWRWPKDYLPSELVNAILSLYKKKTELKGVAEKQIEYQKSKALLNSIFGMMVTDIVQDEITYHTSYITNHTDKEEQIEKYNNNPKRFLYYPWGIFCTAYCRRNLWYAISYLGDDYIYSDTDSVKYMHYEKHADFFDAYNRLNYEKLTRASEYHRIDISNMTPATQKGKIKVLGEFDFEGTYDRFKTLGAKRYMTEENGHITLTVAGVNKKSGAHYIELFEGRERFRIFADDMIFGKGISGKSTHTYIDTVKKGKVKDYTGKTAPYYEQSGVHLEECEYHMGVDKYMSYVFDYVRKIRV